MNAPDRTAWLENRRAGLGGSDIGAILGLSQYKTPVDVWMDKTGRAAAQDETLQMRFGTYAEEFVAQEYSRMTGLSVQRFTKMLHHPTAPLLGNIDRLVVPEGQKRASHQSEIRTDRLLECKTASAFSAYKPDEWGEAGSDAVPMSYLVQVATYRILTGCPYADLAVLFGNQEVRVYHLQRDMELEQMIVSRAVEWWDRYIISDVPPPPVCDGDVRLLYPASSPRTVEADETIVGALAELRSTRAGIAALEEKADAAALLIKSAMGDAEALTWRGTTLATWKSAKAGRKTDWKAICNSLAAPQQLIEMFSTETAGSRRFLLKDETK
jgi:putative phage-type endonuclease